MPTLRFSLFLIFLSFCVRIGIDVVKMDVMDVKTPNKGTGCLKPAAPYPARPARLRPYLDFEK